ncbi:fatty acid synthase-like [Thrips palmi]|uniref:Fatty acid synthase-like n=1 Tax=Thrips palmi TaxID=161013 RepID=A0A6P8YJP6_THRPL|nr:fatty acid synthase-like [Thrips palmi]
MLCCCFLMKTPWDTLKTQLTSFAAVQAMQDEVVISGVGGHFPECDNLQEYREKLLRNLHLISDGAGDLQPRYTAGSPPPDPSATFTRENMKSGKVRCGDKFDNTFFGIHSRLAAVTSSTMRLVLESTVEAVLDAGYSPKDLQGSNTVVCMGYHCTESEANFIQESSDGFGIMGLNSAMIANRVSYWLDLKGTSFVHNTQLVSGMQGLHLAVRAIRNGECDRAIVGAASMSYLSELASHYDDMGWLSPTGCCRPFDEAADGGVRSEAVVVLVLERARTARRAYAEVVHTTSALYAELSRSELPDIEHRVLSRQLSSIYDDWGVDPDHIAYVETDGWGVGAVDAAELGALDDVLGRRRARPLLVGSVKGNIGQTEAASGLVSVCKVLVAMESGTIPATLNHVRANNKIAAIKQGRIKVVADNTPLPPGMVAVNNMGLGGILGHVLLRPNPRVKKVEKALGAAPAPTAASQGPIPKLLLLSGRTPEGLEGAMKLAESNASDPEYVHLLHRAFSSNIPGHMYRGFSVVPKGDDARPAQIKAYNGQKRPVWFVYSGMGSQWAGMGADLMRIPVFAAAVERCHNTLAPLGVDLKHIISTKDPKIFDNILHSFVGIAVVQIGLTDVLRAVGVEPDGMVGHSVGELGCAYADGCITAEQMILAAHARGQATNETKLVPGMMAAVGVGYKDVKAMVPESIDIACHNSSTSCTLSGPAADMDAFVAQLKAKGIFARAVNVSNVAYHSRYIQPAAPRLLELLKGVILEPKKRSSRWISTSALLTRAREHDVQYASPQYFTNNLLSSVYFEEACDQVDRDALAIEIAPHGLLQAILKRSLHQDVVNVALTKRDMPGAGLVLDALGNMYMEGLNPDVAKLYPAVATPVCRDTSPLAPLATWDHRDTWALNFLKATAEGGPRYEMRLPLALATAELSHLADCTWNGHTLLSPATCLSLVLSVVSTHAPQGCPIVLDNVVFFDFEVVPQEGETKVYVSVQRGSGRFEVSVKDRVICTGRSVVISEHDEPPLGPAAAVPPEDRAQVDADAVYEELGRRGLQCRGAYRSLAWLQRGARAVLGGTASREDDEQCVEAVRALQLETLLQVVTLERSEGRHELHVPKRIQKVVFEPAQVLPAGSQDALHFDLLRRCVSLCSPRGRLAVVQVDTQPLPLPAAFPPILVQTRAFLAYAEAAAKDLEHLCSLALQLASLQGRSPLLVAAVAGRSALPDAVARTAQQQLPDLHVRVGSAADVVDSATLDAVRRQRGLLLAELPPGFSPPPELRLLLSVRQGGRRYALLKHAEAVDLGSEVLHVEGGEAALPLERLLLCRTGEAYLVFRGVPMLAVPDVLSTLAAAPGGHRAHCVFLQDAGAPPFALDTPMYAAQLRLGLRVNILQGGRWGWLPRVHLANLSGGGEDGPRLQRTRQLHMDSLQVRCLGVNPYSDAAEDGRTAVGLLDYAGVRAAGVRVMGVCASSAGPLQPDAVLEWAVPPGWADEAAATVPLAYATAAHALHQQLFVRRGERALVVDGASALGHAAIALLLRAQCRVVATVKDRQEEAALRAQFPHAALDTVVGTARDFPAALASRFGARGCVDVALTQGGGEAFKSVFGIMNKFSRLVHVGAGLTDVGSSVGLSNFLLNVSAYSLAWDWPLKARQDTKRRVQEVVRAAIEDGTVRPLPFHAAPLHTLAGSQRRVAEGAGKVVLSVTSDGRSAPPLDASRGCLVVAPAAKAVSLAEWLLSIGARDVSLAPSTAVGAASAWLARRSAQLAAHYGATVRALQPAGPQQLVEAAGRQSPLGLVVTLEQPAERVRALDAATRAPRCTLVALAEGKQDLGALLDVVRRRKDDGLPGVLAVIGDLPTDVRTVPLAEALRCASDSGVHTVEAMQMAAADGAHHAGSPGRNDGGLGGGALSDLLPDSVEALRRLGQALQDGVATRVLPSLIGGGSKDRRNKEVPPVFLVAGLGDSPARELSSVARYMYASAVVVSPPRGASTVEEAAAAVAEAVERAQPSGPYTVAGRGWGGCVALEVARVLAQRRGCHVTAFLLDASTNAMQAAVRPLQSQPGGLATALLKYLLKLDRKAEERVCRASSWPAQVREALGRDDAVLEAALDCVHRRVQGLVDYQPARRGPLDPKVAVTLISKQPYHLESPTVTEVVSEVRTHALLPSMEDTLAAPRQAGTAISAGVHVGRTNMRQRRPIPLAANY